jgi:tellurite resistance protein TehA-like permease
METGVILLWYVFVAYVLLGIVVAVYIHFFALHLLDDSANGGSIGFRILVTPGIIGLWPIVLSKANDVKKDIKVGSDPNSPFSARQIRSGQKVLIQFLTVIILVLLATALIKRPEPYPSSVPPGIFESNDIESSTDSP